MALPDDCGACLYWQEPHGLCQRHAPGPGQHKQEVAFWPATQRTDRCGSGSDGDDQEAARVACGRCIHWHQPGGRPLPPAERRGIAPDWWQESGFCTRYAPSPGSLRGQATFWRVTHASDGCGDGDAIEQGANP